MNIPFSTVFTISLQDGTVIDNRVLADVQAERIQAIDNHCVQLVQQEASDVQQAKALQCLQGQTVTNYDSTKDNAILSTVNQLRATSANLKAQIQTATTCDAVQTIWWTS